MIGSIASFGSFVLAQGATAYSGQPLSMAPVAFRDRRRRPRRQHSAVASLAPSAMSGLMAVQEALAQQAAPPQIDQLCTRLQQAAELAETAPATRTLSLGALDLLA